MTRDAETIAQPIERAYELLTNEDDGRVCRDIPDEACDAQPRSFLTHVVSLSLTKTGDGLADPKLVLSWLLTSAGAPVGVVGLLVPVREAGSLLPQLVTAGWVRGRSVRKWVWVGGSVVQGLSVLAMAGAALTLDGPALGWAVLSLLALFAIARSFCSVSYKDVLGKTVSKSTRGTATGSAGTVAAVVVFGYGLLLGLGLLPTSVEVIACGLLLAGGCWLAASALFSTLAEQPGATDGGGNALSVALDSIKLLRTDAPLRRFIVTRALLTATALAPPFILALGGSVGEASAGLGRLGAYVVASALASVLSTYVWGRLADRSSRRVLMRAAIIAALALAAVSALGLIHRNETVNAYALPGLLFVLMVAYQGVRLGRSTHLVDMADQDTRAVYTALSNTTIGLVLVAGSAFGLLAAVTSPAVVLAVFSGMCVLAAVSATRLDEVQID
ncbi:MAG: MFS transporter [Phycisphaeraceae bacterium]